MGHSERFGKCAHSCDWKELSLRTRIRPCTLRRNKNKEISNAHNPSNRTNAGCLEMKTLVYTSIAALPRLTVLESGSAPLKMPPSKSHTYHNHSHDFLGAICDKTFSL